MRDERQEKFHETSGVDLCVCIGRSGKHRARVQFGSSFRVLRRRRLTWTLRSTRGSQIDRLQERLAALGGTKGRVCGSARPRHLRSSASESSTSATVASSPDRIAASRNASRYSTPVRSPSRANRSAKVRFQHPGSRFDSRAILNASRSSADPAARSCITRLSPREATASCLSGATLRRTGIPTFLYKHPCTAPSSFLYIAAFITRERVLQICERACLRRHQQQTDYHRPRSRCHAQTLRQYELTCLPKRARSRCTQTERIGPHRRPLQCVSVWLHQTRDLIRIRLRIPPPPTPVPPEDIVILLLPFPVHGHFLAGEAERLDPAGSVSARLMSTAGFYEGVAAGHQS